MTYRIRWATPARRALEQTLPESVAAAVWGLVTGPLADSPHRIGKPLRRELAGLWSARRGQYRVIHAIDDDRQVVTIAAVDHRRDVYH